MASPAQFLSPLPLSIRRISVCCLRRLAVGWPVVAQRRSLLAHADVNPPQVHLAGPIAPQFSAELAAHHGIVSGKGLDAGRNCSRTPLARHHEALWWRLHWPHKVSAHAGIVGPDWCRGYRVVVETERYHKGLCF